ncbi:MAG: YebC/PmpR family DNA-binding transcriptional regulator [Rickettsiales bacterium]|nr:YebC/PmpR family DNA-binding transcriptional regulator [Rickettsiales bacterium]|tara:strand:- start:40924 stop:41667 length:744 start_codon:yes stop_codon:yes gene_type:complete
MAGHSQFKNIMHRKGAQDRKRAKVFTKIIRELTVAAKTGSDPSANPRLRAAIATARAANMPKDTMERAIKKGSSGEDTTNYQEVRYEGYGPAGSAIIVEALSDNRNRTASELRTIFNKNDGNLGETGSVSFQFDHFGVIEFPTKDVDFDTVFEKALEAGASDVETQNAIHIIYTEPSELHQIGEVLHKALNTEPKKLALIWKPQVMVDLNNEQLESLDNLISLLEDNDDVQRVFCNVSLPENDPEDA